MDDHAVRLNRIETKLDKLTEAMAMIARVDEKLVAGSARIDRLEYRLDEQESDLDNVKSIVGYNTQSAKIAERFVWLMVSAIVGVVAYGFKI
jgi:cob(I)alamin adenosyltransferase